MKIIFLYPKWTGEYGLFSHFAKKGSTWHPLNLAYLAAVAEQKGHVVKIIDGEVEDMPLERMIEETAAFCPDLIGITATTPFFHIACDLAKGLKARLKETPVMIGGPHVTVLKEKAFPHFFDYAFIGESEVSLSMFLDQYMAGGDNSWLKSIQGLLFRDGDKSVFTGEAEAIQDIDKLPVPARHLLKMDKYMIGTLKGRKKFATIMSVRGCPFKCIFCTTKVFGRRLRTRSPERVIEEIKTVIEQYGIRHFIFLDDTLTMDRKHILTICALINKENLGITFEGSTRANLVDEEIISRMAAAGLIRLSFGLESVDENIRRIMKKEVPLQSYLTANKITNKYGIETLNSCMIGLPGETEDTVRKTLLFLRNSREIKQANISIAVPYPGTELYEMAIKGEHGLKLLIDDFSRFRRYNSAVMSVGDLLPEDLIHLQNDAFVSIYIAPWRWLPVLRKSGVIGLLLTLSRLLRSIMSGRVKFLLKKQLQP